MGTQSWKQIVDDADPDRKEPDIVYEFSSGRKFRQRDGESGIYQYTVVDGEVVE